MRDMPLDDTWFAIDLPVLEKTVELLEGEPVGLRDTDVAEGVGLPVEDVRRALARLENGYVEMRWAMRGPGRLGRIIGVNSDARRAVGQWPTGEVIATRLLAELDERVEATSDPDERSKLVRVRDALTGMGRDIFVDVAGAALSRTMGGA